MNPLHLQKLFMQLKKQEIVRPDCLALAKILLIMTNYVCCFCNIDQLSATKANELGSVISLVLLRVFDGSGGESPRGMLCSAQMVY